MTCPWQFIRDADITPVVGLRSAIILGCDSDGLIHRTFHIVDPSMGPVWIIADPLGCITMWSPILWVPLPYKYQDRNGVSYAHRRLTETIQ